MLLQYLLRSSVPHSLKLIDFPTLLLPSKALEKIIKYLKYRHYFFALCLCHCLSRFVQHGSNVRWDGRE